MTKPTATLTTEEKLRLSHKIDYEGGMDATFIFYSSFPEIKDPEFHKLRLAYEAAYHALVHYLEIDDNYDYDDELIDD